MPERKSDQWLWLATAGFQRLGSESKSGTPQFVHRVAWEPKVDILEREADLLLLVELAGVSPHEMQLEFEPEARQLILRGRREIPVCNCVRSHQLEIFFGDFERRVPLPDADLNFETATAEARDGLLQIILAKQTT